MTHITTDYRQLQGRLNGNEEEESTFYNHHRGVYFNRLQVRLNVIKDTNLALEYLGASHERCKAHIARATLWGINELWEPVHTLFEQMIRCEHQQEGKAGWTQRDLTTRLTALGAGKKQAKAYLERNLPIWLQDICNQDLNLLTEFKDPERKIPFFLCSIAHFLVHVANFGSKKLQESWLELVNPATLSSTERHQNLTATSTTEHIRNKVQMREITLDQLLSLIEKGYEEPLENIVDRLAKEIIQRILPNLTDIDSLVDEISESIDSWALFLVAGTSAKKPKIELFCKLLDLAKQTKTWGTYLLVPKSFSGNRMTPPHYARAVESTHPLASIAFSALVNFSSDMKDFYQSNHQSTMLSVRTSTSEEERVILIPTYRKWIPLTNLKKDPTLGVITAIADPILKGKMETVYELADTLIEQGIGQIITCFEESFSQQAMRETIGPNHLKPLIKIIASYRDALLYTLLAGLKKERATWWQLWPSHFHQTFTNIFLKGILELGASIVKESHIKPIRSKTPMHILNSQAAAILSAKLALQKMGDAFRHVKK